MHVASELDEAHNLVILTITGELTDADVLGMSTRLQAAAGNNRKLSLLLDLRNADGSKITTAAVRQLAAQPLVLSPESRRAVVVPSMLGVGMARMYEILRDGQGGMRVFQDFDEARRWLESGS
jgi:hypothetical protein